MGRQAYGIGDGAMADAGHHPAGIDAGVDEGVQQFRLFFHR